MDKEIFTRLAGNDTTVFEEQGQRLLPDRVMYQKMITPAQQQEELDKLIGQDHYDSFFFVVDVQRHRITSAHNVEKWLGYTDADFTMNTYIKSIHPAQQLIRNLAYYHWTEKLMAGVFKIRFMKHRLSTLISVRHADGHYIYLRQTSIVFQYDKNNCLLEYLNYFVVLKDHENEKYNLRTMDDSGHEMIEWNREVKKEMKKMISNSRIFSDGEDEILSFASDHPHLPVTNKNIAAGINKSVKAMKTQAVRIRDKVNRYFKTDFKNSIEAIIFLMEQGLITASIFLLKNFFMFDFMSDLLDNLTDSLSILLIG